MNSLLDGYFLMLENVNAIIRHLSDTTKSLITPSLGQRISRLSFLVGYSTSWYIKKASIFVVN